VGLEIVGEVRGVVAVRKRNDLNLITAFSQMFYKFAIIEIAARDSV
jgi:hypothetical protein